jgi:hypothetical protein
MGIRKVGGIRLFGIEKKMIVTKKRHNWAKCDFFFHIYITVLIYSLQPMLRNWLFWYRKENDSNNKKRHNWAKCDFFQYLCHYLDL